MIDTKSKRLLFYILTLLIGLLLFASIFHTNNAFTNNKLLENSQLTTETFIQNDQNTLIKNQGVSNYTYDINWKPKDYPLPSDKIMTAITNNIISEERSVKRVDPITKNKFTEKIQVNILLTAVVNSGMLDHTLNWIESLKRTNQDDKFLVFAIDQGVVDELSRRGYGQQVVLIPDDWFHVPLASEFALWKSNDYRPITHAKTLIVERLLYLDVTVWFSDVDIVFLSPHIRETILLQMVERPNTDIVFSQEVDQKSINSGFYMMRPTPVTKQFLHRIIQEQDTTENFTQQRIMNRVLKSMFSRDYSESPYRLLDMLLFPNGRYYFKMEMPLKLGFQPLMVHANYLVGGQKKEALMKAGLWYNN